MIQSLHFEADELAFACRVEPARAERAAWWWFSVSGDSHRYAPFQSESNDTPESVQSRILSYYRALLLRRSQPLDMRATWELRRANLAALRK